MSTLDTLTIRGFKSIRELNDFPLKNINVLIGANGAGKSNLVDFFRMLKAMAEGGLRGFINKNGGGDGFYFNGPKETREIFAQLVFGQHAYRFSLEPTVNGELIVEREGCNVAGIDQKEAWSEYFDGGNEADLSNWSELHPIVPDHWMSVQSAVYDSIASCIVYHFHDTSSTAPMRRDWAVTDRRVLQPDAGNIAPFLYRLKKDHISRYERIRETIQLVAPFFGDFLLEPEQKGDDEKIRLQWKQRGSSFPFQPWQFSDGTIRFICLATALLQPKPPATMVIDEPELGLHPVALDVLAALIHEVSVRTQLLISTQSTLLLDHFDPEHVVVAERAEGASIFSRLETKALEQWISDYSLGELVRRNIIETGPFHA